MAKATLLKPLFFLTKTAKATLTAEQRNIVNRVNRVAFQSSPERGGGPFTEGRMVEGRRSGFRTPSVSASRCHLPFQGRIAYL